MIHLDSLQEQRGLLVHDQDRNLISPSEFGVCLSAWAGLKVTQRLLWIGVLGTEKAYLDKETGPPARAYLEGLLMEMAVGIRPSELNWGRTTVSIDFHVFCAKLKLDGWPSSTHCPFELLRRTFAKKKSLSIRIAVCYFCFQSLVVVIQLFKWTQSDKRQKAMLCLKTKLKSWSHSSYYFNCVMALYCLYIEVKCLTDSLSVCLSMSLALWQAGS